MLKEVMVKRNMLIEEIKITKHIVPTSEQIEVRLRKEEVMVQHNETSK